MWWKIVLEWLLVLAVVAIFVWSIGTECERSNRLWEKRRRRWAFGGWDPAYPNDDVRRAEARKRYETGATKERL